MTDKTYWIALIDIAPIARDPGAPAGGIAWVIGAAPTSAAFKRAVARAPAFKGFAITEWMELDPLEPGYATEAFDGDAVVADLERQGRSLFVDEVQWYEEPDLTV